jgi:hypothetical protein
MNAGKHEYVLLSYEGICTDISSSTGRNAVLGPFFSEIYSQACGTIPDKLPPCLTKRHAMKAYGGVDVALQALLPSALDAGAWPASPLNHFTPWETAPAIP